MVAEVRIPLFSSFSAVNFLVICETLYGVCYDNCISCEGYGHDHACIQCHDIIMVVYARPVLVCYDDIHTYHNAIVNDHPQGILNNNYFY